MKPQAIPAIVFASLCLLPTSSRAGEFHVATTGNDSNAGSLAKPLKSISAAALKAMPGDTITVHTGIYRESVNPPRGGESDTRRITYQSAPGEKVTITGSEPAKNWQKVSGDTWKLTRPNSFFGNFNPFAERVHGDWFSPQGRIHHRGCVYLGKDGLTEAPNLDAVMKPAGPKPLWFARVDGIVDDAPAFLMNVASFKAGSGAIIPAANSSAKSGTQTAPCTEGGQCVGFIGQGNWLRYDNVDFGAGTENIEIRAAATTGTGGQIELRTDNADGELLGICPITVTGDWQKWQSFTAKIKKTQGKKNLVMVFKAKVAPTTGSGTGSATDNTVIYAQFPGIDPNESSVEISVRSTVFTSEKTHIDYITVRGFDLRNAATNWAAPTAGQVGLVTAYWNKGWIIENNEISNSRCCGIALGKYSDQWDGKRGTTEGYYLTIDDALKKDGWTREKIGGHIVRNNHIHQCGQTGIVGSLGCAFSRIENNEIHEINMHGLWSGAEMAGIKFHGALDVVITGNHIYRCGQVAGLWLDWMAQGTQVTHNLFHDNQERDIFTEVNHGPFLIANNILLSPVAYLANSQGGAYAHNLVGGKLVIIPDGRRTPYHKSHSTELTGLHDCPVGDVRWHNNILSNSANLNAYNGASLPVTAAGNVFTKGSKSSKFDTEVLLKPDYESDIKLSRKADGWYLEFNADHKWASEQKRQPVTTAMLGKAKIPDLPFENPDGSPVKIDTDYFGKPRDAANPFPGPFEISKSGKQVFKVWPRP